MFKNIPKIIKNYVLFFKKFETKIIINYNEQWNKYYTTKYH